MPPVVLTLLSPSLRRLVYDRETGKPKGYGFCEYQDQETALSAMRNLNGREFSGRALRVDNAASEKNKEELKSESQFGSGGNWCCAGSGLFGVTVGACSVGLVKGEPGGADMLQATQQAALPEGCWG